MENKPTSPDIGLLLELNAERRAIAEMLEAEAKRLTVVAQSRSKHARSMSPEVDDMLYAQANGHEEAAEMVRARIVVGIATEDSEAAK